MKIKAILLTLLLFGSSSLAVFAEDAAMPQNARLEAWKSMSPEERQAKKAELRQKFQNMTPEEKQAFKENARARFQSLPPEKQQALRNRLARRRFRQQAQ